MVSTDPSTAWDDKLLKNPHSVADKRSRVQKMFAAIAPSYDLNNRLHSFWRDQAWRRKAVKLAELKVTDRVIDIACGTGDLAMLFDWDLGFLIRNYAYQYPADAKLGEVVGVDFTYEMLAQAKAKDIHRWKAVAKEMQVAAESLASVK